MVSGFSAIQVPTIADSRLSRQQHLLTQGAKAGVGVRGAKASRITAATCVSGSLTLSVGGCLLATSNIHSNKLDIGGAGRWALTAALALDRQRNDRAEQLQQLRRQMAAVSGKVGGGRRSQGHGTDVLPGSENLLPVPESLVELLPAGLPRGVVAVLTGARSLPLSMAAAVTAAGGHVTLIGQPGAGLLAAAEMGADLSRLAVIPDPGTDPVEVAAVLMDGMDLVVLGLAGRTVSPTRARAVTARAQHKGCALLVTGGDWQGAPLRLDARVRGYEMSGGPVPGFGRISRVRLAMRARGRMTGPGVRASARVG
jgi:hypothetical protein